MRYRILLIVGMTVALAFTLTRAEFVTYTCDTAGRLIGVNYGSGKTTAYQYDVSGNLRRAADLTITDTDNDGMADSWEQSHFQTLSRDGSGDFDNDGFSDVAEFLAGTLPNDQNSLLRMNRNVTNNVTQTTVGWSSVIGKTYRVQYKNHLTDTGWNDLAGIVTATGTNAVKVDVTSAGEPQRFYRVEALP